MEDFDLAISILNQIGKPSVLIFFFLSGLAFSRHRLTVNFQPFQFYLNRAVRLLPPYFMVSAAALILYGIPDLNSFLFSLFDGSAMYHLYFVALIFYCYLLFPFMKKIPYTPLHAGVLLSLFLAGNMALSFREAQMIGLFGETQIALPILSLSGKAALWLDYMLYALTFFQIGIWTGLKGRPERPVGKRPHLNAALPIAVGFLIVLVDFLGRTAAGIHADDAGRTWRLSVALYAMTWLSLLTTIEPRVSPQTMRKMARASFLVYLIHPFVINATKDLGFDHPIPHVLLVVSLSWGFALGLLFVSKKILLVGLMTGEGDRIMEPRTVSVNTTQAEPG